MYSWPFYRILSSDMSPKREKNAAFRLTDELVLLFSSLFFSLDAARAWLCLPYTRDFPCVSIGVLNSDHVLVCLLSRPLFSARVVPTRRVATSWRVRNARARTTESSPRP